MRFVVVSGLSSRAPHSVQGQPHRAVLTSGWHAGLIARFVSGDTLPADANLAWWQQKLRDRSARRSRHPLGRVLEPVAAPWPSWPRLLPAVREIRSQPISLVAALALLRPFAEAIVAVEAVLFQRVHPAEACAVAVQWLAASGGTCGSQRHP